MMAATSRSIKISLSQPNDKNAACNADGYTSNGVHFKNDILSWRALTKCFSLLRLC